MVSYQCQPLSLSASLTKPKELAACVTLLPAVGPQNQKQGDLALRDYLT